MIEASMLKTDSVRVIAISEATRYCIPGIVPPHHYITDQECFYLGLSNWIKRQTSENFV